MAFAVTASSALHSTSLSSSLEQTKGAIFVFFKFMCVLVYFASFE